MVVLAALITLPVFAEQKKPTPTAVAKRQGEVKATPAPADTTTYSRSNNFRKGQVKATPAPAEATWNGSRSNNYRQANVVSTSGTNFTVMVNGKKVIFSGAKLKALPKVGDIIDISYTETGGMPEATTIKGSNSNGSE